MNYDKWKLSNPIDDGYGYNYVSNCCGAKLDESEQICSYCKEGCEAIEDYEYEAIQKENYLEMNNEKE
tara:strand:- start:147 stop:350 length:204 start_codon:yes stop_codon:yes gene_type:complete